MINIGKKIEDVLGQLATDLLSIPEEVTVSA